MLNGWWANVEFISFGDFSINFVIVGILHCMKCHSRFSSCRLRFGESCTKIELILKYWNRWKNYDVQETVNRHWFTRFDTVTISTVQCEIYDFIGLENAMNTIVTHLYWGSPFWLQKKWINLLSNYCDGKINFCGIFGAATDTRQLFKIKLLQFSSMKLMLLIQNKLQHFSVRYLPCCCLLRNTLPR